MTPAVVIVEAPKRDVRHGVWARTPGIDTLSKMPAIHPSPRRACGDRNRRQMPQPTRCRLDQLILKHIIREFLIAHLNGRRDAVSTPNLVCKADAPPHCLQAPPHASDSRVAAHARKHASPPASAQVQGRPAGSRPPCSRIPNHRSACMRRRHSTPTTVVGECRSWAQ